MTQGNTPGELDKAQVATFGLKWPCIEPVVQKLVEQQPVSQKQWQDMFYTIHQVCLWDDKGPMNMHKELEAVLDKFIRQAHERVVHHEDEQALLRAYITEWRKFFTQCDYLPTPFRTLENALLNKNPVNANYGTHKKDLSPDDSIVRKLMLSSWSKIIFSDIKGKLQKSAMKLVEAERNGESFDSNLVIGVRESFVNLCSNPEKKMEMYKNDFEMAYIQSTNSYYSLKIDEHLQKHGVLLYMEYADNKLREEEKRARQYLVPESVGLLTKCCEDVLLKGPLAIIVEKCPCLIENQDTKYLNLMFRLLDRTEKGVEEMQEHLQNHIISAGIADMKASAAIINQDSEKYVEKLLNLYKKFTKLIEEAFQSDNRFTTSRDKAYKNVVDDISIFSLELPMSINNRGNKTTQAESKCPDLLATFCDMLLKKSGYNKRLTSEQIDGKLRDVLLVLKYIKNKDVFMRKYQISLARRLILDNSADSYKEEEMVELLGREGMPPDIVNKLRRMFQDIKVSEDLNSKFKDEKNVQDGINMKILNAGAWSKSSERVTISLPIELEDFIPQVEEFYKSTHSGRKLQWYYHMSNGTITFINSVGKFDLDVTTFQMAVLFAWNQRPKEKISYESLKLATELPDIELKRTLWSLVSSTKNKCQVLLYEPLVQNPKDYTENTQFWVNQEFAIVKNNKTQKRGKLNLIGRLMLGSEKTQIEDNQSIVQLRILRTQEAIIKILKMRKCISNSALQDELVTILKNWFLPNKKMVKEQLEWLIENKYMKRDDDDINTFIYIA